MDDFMTWIAVYTRWITIEGSMCDVVTNIRKRDWGFCNSITAFLFNFFSFVFNFAWNDFFMSSHILQTRNERLRKCFLTDWLAKCVKRKGQKYGWHLHGCHFSGIKLVVKLSYFIRNMAADKIMLLCICRHLVELYAVVFMTTLAI